MLNHRTSLLLGLMMCLPFNIHQTGKLKRIQNLLMEEFRLSYQIEVCLYFRLVLKKLNPHLDSDTTLKNISLQELAEHELAEMTSSEFRNFDLIKQNKVTVGGNDGWKMEFAAEDSFYLFEICTIADGKIYILTYQDYASKVPETLPLANKMVESFQIITE